MPRLVICHLRGSLNTVLQHFPTLSPGVLNQGKGKDTICGDARRKVKCFECVSLFSVCRSLIDLKSVEKFSEFSVFLLLYGR